MSRIAAAILAGGEARRTGQPRQLQPCRGATLVRAMTYEICEASCDKVAVVLGAHAQRVRPEVADLPVVTLPNPLWSEGMASSIRAAVVWAVCVKADALALFACDQPKLTAKHVDRLCAAYRLERRSVGSYYAGVLGVPAVFDRAEFTRLFELAGDSGVRQVLLGANPVSVDWPEGVFELDTPGHAARL